MTLKLTPEEYRRIQRELGHEPENVEDISPLARYVQNLEHQARPGVPLARANLVEPEINFASKTEKRAWEEWLPTIGAKIARYEPFSLKLNSGNYKPDFMLVMPDGEIWLIEVKGSWNAYQSGRSSKKSLKEAAKMYWFLARFFSLLPKKGGGWNFEEVK